MKRLRTLLLLTLTGSPGVILLLLTLAGCAGIGRGCSSWSFGADWLIVQYRNDGTMFKCWRLPSTSVTKSDGIYWKDPRGHLVHISGWYNRVQVSDGDWAGAAGSLDLDLKACR